jgi:hypothetical protein
MPQKLKNQKQKQTVSHADIKKIPIGSQNIPP